MTEQMILNLLRQNPEFMGILEGMLLRSNQAKPHEDGDMFVWCAEMHDANTDTLFYHPIVIPSETASIMDIESMMHPSAYKMAAYNNQFAAYRMESTLSALNAYGVRLMLISVNKTIFNTLQTRLTALITQILQEIEKCFKPLERVSALTNIQNTHMLKLQLLSNILSKITTTSYCFDENMVVHNSNDHVYNLNRPLGYDEDVEDDDFEYEDEDCIF